MRRNIAAIVVMLLGLVTLGGCASTSAKEGSANRVSVVGFSVLEAANEPLFAGFADTSAGEEVAFQTSYGASGDQSRAVEGGLDADLVHFSLEPDLTRLVESGQVASDWKSGPTQGIATSSVVSLVVREGNPLNIQGWDDLVKPGIEIITPNPASSGSAKWNILAAWGHVAARGGSDTEAEAFVAKLLENTIALPGSAREATTAFSEGNGDVLISYENEAILARANGEPFDYVVPEDTLLIENPAAVVEGANPVAEDLLAYLISPEGQAAYALSGFRPLIDGVTLPEVDGAHDPNDPFPAPHTLLTIDADFGGWGEANTRFFDEEDGIITRLHAETGATQ
jgi:sulfate/thiosulfate transport system substrate-binding protein